MDIGYKIVSGLPKEVLRPVAMTEFVLADKGESVVIRCHAVTDYDKAVWCDGKIRARLPSNGEHFPADCQKCGRKYRIGRSEDGRPFLASYM